MRDPTIPKGEPFSQQEFYPSVFDAELEIPEVDLLSNPARAYDEVHERMADIEQRILKRFPDAEDAFDDLPNSAYDDPWVKTQHDELNRLSKVLDQMDEPKKEAGGGKIRKISKELQALRDANKGEVPGQTPRPSAQQMRMMSLIEEYTEKSIDNFEMVPDPRQPGMFAVQTTTGDDVMQFLVNTNVENVMDEGIESVEFSSWPPTVGEDNPLGNYAGGGKIRSALSKRWRIWDTKAKEYVSQPYTNKKRARTRMDKLDNEYGAYRYQVREVEGKAGGGKIKKFSRRDILKGLGAGTAAAGAGALGMGKAAVKKGSLEDIEKALDIGGATRPFAPPAWSKQDMTPRQWKTIERYIGEKLDDLYDHYADFHDAEGGDRPRTQQEQLDMRDLEAEINQLEFIESAEPDYVFDPSAQEYLEEFIEDTVSDLGIEIHDYGDFDSIDDPRVQHLRELERVLSPKREWQGDVTIQEQLLEEFGEPGERSRGGLGPRERGKAGDIDPEEFAGGGGVKRALKKLEARRFELEENSDPDIDLIAREMMKDPDTKDVGRRILANESKVEGMSFEDAQKFYERISRLFDEAMEKLKD